MSGCGSEEIVLDHASMLLEEWLLHDLSAFVTEGTVAFCSTVCGPEGTAAFLVIWVCP